MKRICMDFAPAVRVGKYIQKPVAVAGILLAIAGTMTWQLRPPVDTDKPGEHNASAYPAPEAIQAVDTAIRNLNIPWPDALEALEAIFEKPADGALISVETNVERLSFKVSGEARDPGFVQGIPTRLKALQSVADSALIGQEQQGNSAYPVLFTLEFRLREPS